MRDGDADNLHTVLPQGQINPLSFVSSNAFMIPVYFTLGLLTVQVSVEVRRFRWIRNLPDVSSTPTHSPTWRVRRFLEAARRHVKAQDRITAALNVLRLLGTLTLAVLSAASLLMCEHGDRTETGTLRNWCENHPFKEHREPQSLDFSHDEWIEVIYVTLYSYAALLAIMTIVSPRRCRSVAGVHLTLIMLAVVGVYAYRDIYPLGTFALVPEDAAQGWLLWTRIGIVSLVAILVPSVMPRIYHPVDPLNPAKEVSSEQTASWLSFLTYTFMDETIWLAARTPHLEYESLSPLADYDAAAHLVAKSEKTLDSFLHRKKRHLFWGLMHYFAWEYAQLTIMTILRTLAGFISPLAIYGLLAHLESNGENAFVRPWVWILCLFLGPNIGSIVLQYYLYLTTRSLVRTEGILTQLVFEHALRIRTNEELQSKNTPATMFNTPETGSMVEVESGSARSEEETLHGSGGLSTASSANKKDEDISDTTLHGGTEYAGGKPSDIVGKINNLVTTDLGNIIDGRDFLFVILYGPLQVTLCVWFLYAILSWSALVGMFAMVLTLPLPGYVAKLINKVQTERMTMTDARIQTVTDVLSVIRMTKLFGWEQKVNMRISEKRENELRLLKKRQFLILLNGNLSFFLPLFTMLVTFSSYTVIQGKDLDASILFSSIAIFDMLRDVLNASLYLLPAIINAKVSLGRTNDFLHNTELLDRFKFKDTDEEAEVDPSHSIDSAAIGFCNATFLWGGSTGEGIATQRRHRFRLTIEGELFFQPQKLNLVIGPTGSGKTSLLMALLGEMHYEANAQGGGFNLPRDGGVAYAAQESWVQSETIKENILFGKAYQKQRYDKVIYQCGLERDLSLFEAGDSTEVGEKGLTLSGGQKARITLARAVYSDAEILLLDDILAALDVHTARFIVDKCLQGDLLRGRTIILVTHNVAMVAPIADFVVSLGMDGGIANKGTIPEVLASSHALLPDSVTKMNEVTGKTNKPVDAMEPIEGESATAKLVVPEEIPLGHVGWPALKLYLSSLGGIFFWVAVLSGLLLAELVVSISTWFLGYWASQYDEQSGWAVPVAFYLSVYSLMLLFIIFLYSVALVIYLLGSIKAARMIHQKLITSVLGTTLRWLDTVPTARVIARCTQDIRAVDGPVSETLEEVIELTITLFIKFCAAIIFVPIFVLPGIAVFVVGGVCGQLYIKAQLSIKREMSNRRSPVLAHFGAAISGLTSIRAYNAEAMFRSEILKRIDGYTRPARAFYNCNRWICIRVDAIGGIFAAGLAAVIVYGKNLLNASNTGFSLTMAVGFSSLILWWVRVLNEFEVQGNSLERIDGYVGIEQEPKATEGGKPPAYWPASGSLNVENLSARYSVGSPMVLHNISFEVKSGERIGIVGRTGSGKSTLTLSLLRCIPIEGRVTLDGIPTDTINLDALRSSITIIPQQPELLSGTLRENLDPFSEHSDVTLNDALRSAGLFSLQDENDPSKITLDTKVSGAGGNLSVGQRQILALARAIVRQSKLLVLDEATSAIDYATDTIIQNALRELLSDATLITIAHRLQTIMDADKIIVLDEGKMIEFDSPTNLLKNEGHFWSLVNQSDDRDALWQMARESARRKQRAVGTS